jgi:outer membrane protein OmpA-like peptidoglycan-associated protein
MPLLSLAVLLCAPAQALELQLHSVQFPERTEVDLDFTSRPGAPSARVRAEVTYRDGQAQINLKYDDMKPAILYGGDVTCYVLWGVGRDGVAENLGEMIIRDDDAKLDFHTASKDFALLVTAEPYYLVPQPSELVLFSNLPSEHKRSASNEFRFSGFAPAPLHDLASITNVRWDADAPLELLQARKALELAGRRDARTHAPRLYRDAERALAAADEYASKGKDKKRRDYARRVVSLSNEAINVTMNRLESIELEKQVNARREELASLEAWAIEAENRARDAEADASRARDEVDQARAEIGTLVQEKADLTLAMGRLRQDKSHLEEVLQGAFSKIAETKSTARGYVVSLPDILFEVDEAVLKPEAQLVVAELAGILHVMPELRVEVEGHTDSTGTAEYNLDLSRRRAEAVLAFLGSREVPLERLRARGYGEA